MGLWEATLGYYSVPRRKLSCKYPMGNLFQYAVLSNHLKGAYSCAPDQNFMDPDRDTNMCGEGRSCTKCMHAWDTWPSCGAELGMKTCSSLLSKVHIIN